MPPVVDVVVRQLWDLKQAKTLAEFTAHTAAVGAVQFHPNEYLLASGGADRCRRPPPPLAFRAPTDVSRFDPRCVCVACAGG